MGHVAWDCLFCSSNQHVFTIELLDCWVYEVCGKGSTFRDSFVTWFESSNSATARLNRLGDSPIIGRRQANEAFFRFLQCLKFPTVNDLNSLFSCSTSETHHESGYKQLDGIVMDGTATGYWVDYRISTGGRKKYGQWVLVSLFTNT